MKGDFTRNTFRRDKFFSSVRQQQGRVQLDADWNEAFDIMAYRDRTTRIDVIGCCGGPIHNAGYEITSVANNLRIGAGRYYVAGILCENDADHLVTDQARLPGYTLPDEPGTYLVYLDVWERHITALEDPDIREVALGGPDTATRLQVTPQVKLTLVADNANCSDFGCDWVPPAAASTARMAARSQPGGDSDEPCEIPPTAGYRRLENQLYRVEIHNIDNAGKATFKWSRENGSVVFSLDDQDGADKLILGSLPRDQNLGLATGDWVELTDDDRELQGKSGILVQILQVDGEVVTIDPATIDDVENPAATAIDLDSFGPNPKLRRWESDAAEPVVTGAWIELGDEGVQIQFDPAAGHDRFHKGDYWQIPARTIPGDVLWPIDETTNAPEFQPRHGIHHYYCPLALVRFDRKEWHWLADCRRLFPPLSELPEGGQNCCTVTVGDGAISVGDYDDIQEAVDALDGSGRVCILPGVYQLRKPVSVSGQGIIISGCGFQGRIIAADGQPAFIATKSRVRFENLSVDAAAPDAAVVLQDCYNSAVVECNIHNRQPTPEIETVIGSTMKEAPEYYLRRDRRLGVTGETQFDKRQVTGGGPAVLVLDGEHIALIDNRLLGLPAAAVQVTGGQITGNWLAGGGIQVWDGSAAVTINGNHITFGDGPGIVLGGVRGKEHLRKGESGIDGVTITGNTITLMAHNGIATNTETEGVGGLGDIEDVTIARNRIEANARAPKGAFDGDGLAVGGIVMHNVSSLRIHENEILYNGGPGIPACGVYVRLCEEVEVTNNHILENGDSGEAADCIDFRAMAIDKGDGPLVLDQATFTLFDQEGNETGYWNITGTEDGNALDGRYGARIELAEPAEAITLTYANGATSGKLVAINEDGSTQEMDLPSGDDPITLSVSGPGIVEIKLEAPQNEFFILELCLGEAAARRSGYQAGIAALFVASWDIDMLLEERQATFAPGAPALFAHGNVVVCPAGPALMAVGAGPMLINDNALSSRGEHIRPADDEMPNDPFLNVALLAQGAVVVNYGSASDLLGAALTAQSMTFHGVVDTVNRLEQPAAAAAQRKLPGGHTAFHDNQVALELLNPAGPIAPPALAIVSGDDVSIQNNQVETTLANAPQLVDVLAFGVSVRVSGNRIAETLNAALVSCLSYGIVNNTSDNVANHCVFVLGYASVDRDNLVLNTTYCGEGKTALAAFIAVAAAQSFKGGGS